MDWLVCLFDYLLNSKRPIDVSESLQHSQFDYILLP